MFARVSGPWKRIAHTAAPVASPTRAPRLGTVTSTRTLTLWARAYVGLSGALIPMLMEISICPFDYKVGERVPATQRLRHRAARELLRVVR